MRIIGLFLILLLSLWGESNENVGTPKIKIALIAAPSVVGRYAQTTYNVALATLMASGQPFELVAYDLPDESQAALSQTLEKINRDNMQAILAPLTLGGVKNLLTVYKTDTLIFIPTVHKRDIGIAPETIIFGAIDYQAQIEALLPYMANALAVFYDASPIGLALSRTTQDIASEAKKSKKSTLYSIDTQGSNIVKYLAKPSAFTKKSIIIHLPVVKTSMLAAQLTFTGAREHNILSTQINFDPTLITLT
ncbi:MAG: hypothetical protein ACXWVU_03580, partial [Sulfuricurvum sp.]